ncbi:aminoglycoside phosphotransferase family protein [Legionella fallonii]|uniref:Aminoglycoside phosphotransferase n=1 Tax=Legionella fallonii LLAP-10 TaxID=1212491 RepID=A0A098G483_9GAMM|nr:aminoglycoside phosphotransferase family protein [Legionella fallonii]CEG57282.1 Aminoglycoside phosphotransferase [Legionella fallonii LLAP-10]
MNHNKPLVINDTLVRHLVATQFPQWKNLPVRPVARSGWDNRTFHLGNEMLVRMPSDAEYALQVDKEQRWLPKLAPKLPLPIPTPLALGEPAVEYPWHWSVYQWIDGEAAASAPINNLKKFATDLAQFLAALEQIDSTDGPLAGPHSFYRGGPLQTYDAETRQALEVLRDSIDVNTASEVWEAALATHWHDSPVWVHGDISVGNLLVKDGQLNAVIDFGQLAVGDPACDLAISWTLFKDESREAFRSTINLDADTWARGRAWTLWKALICAANLTNSNAAEATQALRIINEVLSDHKNLRSNGR